MSTVDHDRRIFLEVRDPAVVTASLDRDTVFVPTRLQLPLGEACLLALRMPKTTRALEIPVIVIGRRPLRGGSPLAAGLTVRLADPAHPMMALLREFASGRVVDLEARIQEQARIPVRAMFPTTEDAVASLRGLAVGDAHVPVDAPVTHGDRLALTVSSAELGGLVTLQALVHAVHMRDGERVAVVTALDGAARAAVDRYLSRVPRRGAQA